MSRKFTKDFFISYTQANRDWAEWIGWVLETAGYTVVIQAWDFAAGKNFVTEMDEATSKAQRTIAVLSPKYLESGFSKAEWASAFARDPTGQQRILLPIRVEPCDLTGLLGQIVYIDLVDQNSENAERTLLAKISGERSKPPTMPSFPGGSRPAFPPSEKNQSDNSGDLKRIQGMISNETSYQSGKKSLILFIHGFDGDPETTWGRFPDLIQSDDDLSCRFDMRSHEYPKLVEVGMLADELNTRLRSDYLTSEDYDGVILVGHSLGGLVARRYLLDCYKRKEESYVSGSVFFATPHEGATLARVAKLVDRRNQQLKQLCANSEFLRALNEDWATFGLQEIFDMHYIVGTEDRIVTPNSAKHFYGNRNVHTVHHGHLDIVKPESSDDPSFKVLRMILLGFCGSDQDVVLPQTPVSNDEEPGANQSGVTSGESDLRLSQVPLKTQNHRDYESSLKNKIHRQMRRYREIFVHDLVGTRDTDESLDQAVDVLFDMSPESSLDWVIRVCRDEVKGEGESFWQDCRDLLSLLLLRLVDPEWIDDRKENQTCHGGHPEDIKLFSVALPESTKANGSRVLIGRLDPDRWGIVLSGDSKDDPNQISSADPKIRHAGKPSAQATVEVLGMYLCEEYGISENYPDGIERMEKAHWTELNQYLITAPIVGKLAFYLLIPGEDPVYRQPDVLKLLHQYLPNLPRFLLQSPDTGDNPFICHATKINAIIDGFWSLKPSSDRNA